VEGEKDEAYAKCSLVGEAQRMRMRMRMMMMMRRRRKRKQGKRQDAGMKKRRKKV
jgi:hypothetical protein